MAMESNRSFTPNITIDAQRVVGFLPLSMGSYGTGPGTAAVAVGTNSPVGVPEFRATSPDFQAALYRDSVTGKYTISIAGTNDLKGDVIADLALAGQDLRLPNWHPQYKDALNFGFEVVKQLRDELKVRLGQEPSLDDIRANLQVTGHSLGGALAELVAKFFGLSGSNIDGPGVAMLTKTSEFGQAQAMVREQLPDLQTDYAITSDQFSSHAVSIVGMAGRHLVGMRVEATEEAQSAFASAVTKGGVGAAMTAAGSVAGVISVVGGLATAGASAGTQHPSGTILANMEAQLGITPESAPPSHPYTMLALSETMASIKVGNSSTLAELAIDAAARTVEANVKNGLSPTGLSLDGGATRVGPFSVMAFRDAETGQIKEIYTVVDSVGATIAGSTFVRQYVVDETGRVGQFDEQGRLNFVARDKNGHVAVVSVSHTGLVQVKDALGRSLDVAVEPAVAADMMTGKGGWLETVKDHHPISWSGDQEGPPPTVSGLDPATPVSYPTLVVDGQTYQVTANGTLDRQVPGHPGWTESRDGTGGGVIMDEQGYTVAQLQPGDRVRMMDDGRIVVNDLDGKVVNRVVDEAAGDSFYTSAPPIVEPPPDIHLPADSGGGGAGLDLEETGTSGAGGTGPAQPPAPAPEPNPYSYTNYLNASGLNAGQQAALATQLDNLNLGGEGALSFITLPGGGATLIQNADGDIVGEINQLANGSKGYTRLSGVRINADGSAEPYTAYVAPNGQALTPEQYNQARASEAASAVGLMNSIIGLQHWDNMGDLQRLAAVTSIYNAVDKMSGGAALPGNLGTAASVLGLLNALDQGNLGGTLISGISLVDAVADGMASKAIGNAFGMDAANVVPGLSLVLALDSGDPVSVLAAAANFIPVYGQIISICITLLGGMFESDIPMKEGQAHAQWDAQGNTIVITDQDTEGGGATATGWMNSIANGLQAQLAGTRDAAGNSYALIPNLLPAIGYQYDPDGFNYGVQGHMYLQWVDAQGTTQTRYYDGQGNREDGTGETLAGDFMERAQAAIAPAWQVATVLAHWQQGRGISTNRYQINSCLRAADKGYRPISCMKRQRRTSRAGPHGHAKNIFRHLTLLGDAQRLNARQNFPINPTRSESL